MNLGSSLVILDQPLSSADPFARGNEVDIRGPKDEPDPTGPVLEAGVPDILLPAFPRFDLIDGLKIAEDGLKSEM